MSKLVDARGLPCPQPVILTKAAMQEDQEVMVVVDNTTAQENVTKMAEKSRASVTAEKKNDGIYLRILSSREGNSKPSDRQDPQDMPDSQGAVEGPLVVVISSDTMGRGDDELGSILVRGFLYTLNEVEPLPDVLIFLNSGVKLTVEGSEVLEDLKNLADRGVTVLACGTCLGHFGLKEKLAVGEISNMYTIAETLLEAGKTVTI